MAKRKKIVALTGAGISAESGIKTFRDAGGLWEGHDVMSVASPQGWHDNQELVLQFYNERRRQLKEVQPNLGHKTLAALEKNYAVTVITQNVDDLHERAGSTNIIHLHGELTKVRSVTDETLISETTDDVMTSDLASDGSQLRPHIVWFGETVPELEQAAQITADADIVIIVGTSMQVYPAAGLVGYAPAQSDIYYIDPRPTISYELSTQERVTIIEDTATVGLPALAERLLIHTNGEYL